MGPTGPPTVEISPHSCLVRLYGGRWTIQLVSRALTGQLPHPLACFQGETHTEVEVAETHMGFPTASPRSPPTQWSEIGADPWVMHIVQWGTGSPF